MTQIWEQQFHDVATFFTQTYSRDSFGQQSKTPTILYNSIPCSLRDLSPGSVQRVAGLDEQYKNQWRVDVAKEFGDAVKGSRVDINGDTYIIKKKVIDTDFNGNTAFFKYYIEELE